ncbi:protein kibra-like isoform X2 [Tigriopus californicus]|uniref:protein kibra-like isoform X2 n=1 Tax=Tigriopus californicus TaxID=6832 RepID=UPI0027DA1AB1|nr:protein kibra-like isoform X2 [Tigriopus californicus]
MPKEKRQSEEYESNNNNHTMSYVDVNNSVPTTESALLPQGWDVGRDFDGKVYYIDHNTKKTTWIDPRIQLNRSYHHSSSNVSEPVPMNHWEQMVPDSASQGHRRLPTLSSCQLADSNRSLASSCSSSLQPAPSLHEVSQSRLSNHHVPVPQQHSSHGHYPSYPTGLPPLPLLHHAPGLPNGTLEPNPEWRGLQEDMLRQYLATAECDLRAKQELVDIKQQRLHLAQDEFRHLNNTLTALSASNSSFHSSPTPSTYSRMSNYGYGSAKSASVPASACGSASTSPYLNAKDGLYTALCKGFHASQTSLNSTGSVSSTKYDPDLLKSDVQHAKARVQRLKQELANIDTEMSYKQKGVETLANVSAKYSDEQHNLTLEEAQAIKNELYHIQKSLSVGEQEKIELMKSLACLKDDLTRLQHSESSLDVCSAPMEKFSTASQTDISGEMIPVGTRLAEMAKLRLQYDEARRYVQDIQQSLASLEERMLPGQLESDKDRLLLIQDKEQLLRELRSITPRSRSNHEMTEIREKIRRLEQDLNNAMEISNRRIAERLKIHEDKQILLQQLRDGLRAVSRLESQLKLLSASTMSMSSSSSLGSLSSSHASSKGSLSSLSFTDIYGLSTTTPSDPSMLDLHRRVDKILNNNATEKQSESSSSNDESSSLLTPESETSPLSQSQMNQISNFSSRSSLNSVSPPVSPQDAQLQPPSYEQAFLGSNERQRRLQHQQQHMHLEVNKVSLPELTDFKLGNRAMPPKLSTISENLGRETYNSALMQSTDDFNNPSEPLSPISESVNEPLSFTSGIQSKASSAVLSSSASVVASAGISEESVAGDSGVFEASTRKQSEIGGLSSSLETAQVQISLRYSLSDSLLHIGLERARNLAALFIPENRKICMKASLLPSPVSTNWTFCSQSVTNIHKPTFGETFPVSVSRNKLGSKTLQVNVWSTAPDGREECLGAAQVSLADFDIKTVRVQWYNILSYHFMRQPNESRPQNHHESALSSAISSKQSTLKEESSDESTIISSQTSTLTRNIGPEALMAQFGIAAGDLSVVNGEFEPSDDENDESALHHAEMLPTEKEIMFTLSALDQDQIENDQAQLPQDLADKETNTECVFLQPSASPRKSGPVADSVSALVKRSQTFSPSAPINKSDYNCRLIRSDSDSAMSIRKRLAFQRSMLERRSLRVPANAPRSPLKSHSSKSMSKSGSSSAKIPSIKTSLDLELDLAAQQTKLKLLQDEIDRLKDIKDKLESERGKGNKELPMWFQEQENLQQIMSKLQTDNQSVSKSKEEKRIEKMLRKTDRDIYKLRKMKTASKGQLDILAFKEKMAFFTTIKNEVPAVITTSEIDSDAEQVEDEDTASESGSTLKHALTSRLDQLSLEESVVDSEPNPPRSRSLENVQERFTYEIDPDIGVIV